MRRLLKHPLASGARDLMIAQTYTGFLRVATVAFAARVLGPSGLGSAAVLIAYPTLIWTFIGVKSGAITTRYMTNYWVEGKTGLLGEVVKLGYKIDAVTATVAFAITSATIVSFSPDVGVSSGEMWLAMVFASALPVYSLSGTATALLSSLGMFRNVAALQAVEATLTLFLIGGALLVAAKVSSLVIASALAFASTGLLSFALANRVAAKKGIPTWRRNPARMRGPSFREMLRPLGWNYLAVTFSGMLVHLPLLILGRIGGAQQAGYLRAATSIVAAGSYAENAMGRVAYPALTSRWSEGDPRSVKSALRAWTLKGGLPVGTMLLLVSLTFPLLIPFVFGTAYAPMVFGAQLLMVGTAVSGVFFYGTQFFYATGRVDEWTKIFGVNVLVVVTLAVPAALIEGFVGVASVIAVATVVFNLVVASRIARMLNSLPILSPGRAAQL